MKTIFVPYAKKARQFKGLSRKIRRWIADGSFMSFSQSKQNALLGKLRKLYAFISNGRPAGMRKLAFSAAIAGGMALSTPVSAQNFVSPIGNPFGLTGSYSFPTFADLDTDGDLDIVALRYINGQNSLVFVENQGTATTPQYGNELINPFGLGTFESLTTFEFTDIDDDGDLDFFAGDYYGGGLRFKPNEGTPENPAFGAFQDNPFQFQTNEQLTIPVFADIDNDGDQDIFSSIYGGQVLFFENTGTPASATYTTPVASPFSIETGATILLFDFADLDNDGDLDLMASDIYGGLTGLIKYQENQGSPEAASFAASVSWPFNIEIPKTEPYFAIVFGDIDSDGDQDMISGGYESTILYFENTGFANTPPTSANAQVSALQDQEFFFAASDFPFTDPDAGQGLSAIQILSLPLNGTLKYNGVAINIGQFITAANIPGFTFTPDPGEFGANYAAFSFRVYDGVDYSADDYNMVINVTEVVGTANIQSSDIKVYPNPAQDIVRINGKWNDNDAVFSLYNQQGALVMRENLADDNKEINHVLQVGQLASGVYQWIIQGGEQELSGKVLKL